MILFFLVGVIGVIIALLFKRSLLNMIPDDHSWVIKLRNRQWFSNYWLAGAFLFCLNGVLFFGTLLILYALIYLFIPFFHLLVMLFAVIGSILFWLIIHKAWCGIKQNRWKLGVIGSGFYLILTSVFVYMYATLEPTYPGEDMFMKGMGLFLAIIVTTVACITCFVITGFSHKSQLPYQT